MRRGYWDMPAETAIVLSTGGWLSTGDRLPRSPIGKILRRRLKEEQAASVGGRLRGARARQ